MSLTDLYKEGIDPLEWCETLVQVQAWKEEGRPGPYPPPHIQPGLTTVSGVAPQDLKKPQDLQVGEATSGSPVQPGQDLSKIVDSGCFVPTGADDGVAFDTFLAKLDDDGSMMSRPGNDETSSYTMKNSISTAVDNLGRARASHDTTYDDGADEITDPRANGHRIERAPTNPAPCYDSNRLRHRGDYFRPGGVFTLEQKQLVDANRHLSPADMLHMLQQQPGGATQTRVQVKGALQDARRKQARREATGDWTERELRILRDTVNTTRDIRPAVLFEVLTACCAGFAKNVEQVRSMKDAIAQKKRYDEAKRKHLGEVQR